MLTRNVQRTFSLQVTTKFSVFSLDWKGTIMVSAKVVLFIWIWI